MGPPTHLEGTTFEGGGQLLRVALSFSSLTGVPVHISNIRGKRGPKSAPGKAGGLKPAHLAGAEWLAKVTGAETTGLKVQSRELIFRPDRRCNKGKDLINDVWKEIYDDSGRIVRLDSHISMSTPGSIFSVLQAILPYILFSAPQVPLGTSSSEKIHDVVPVRITIEGGTNVSKSPSFEYADQVLLPMLNLKAGIPALSMKLARRGWSQGRVEVGSVTFDINPLPHGTSLSSFSFTERGELAKVHVSILAPGTNIRQDIREKVTKHVLHRHPGIEILFPVDEDSKHLKRVYLLLVAETTSGYRFGRDWLFDRKCDLAKVTDELVLRVVNDVDEELDHEGCVDEYLQDQLVIFQALSQGKSIVDLGKGTKPSLHTQTVRWVGQEILNLNFDGEGACEGISFEIGEKYWERQNSERGG